MCCPVHATTSANYSNDNKQTNERTNERTNKQTNERTNERTNKAAKVFKIEQQHLTLLKVVNKPDDIATICTGFYSLLSHKIK